MGLLDFGSSIDPQSLATLQLAGGLLSPGSFGQGISRGVTGYQGSLAAAQNLAAQQQDMQIRSIALQQNQRMFDLQTPFMEEALRRMRAQNAPPVAPASPNLGPSVMAGAGSQPSFMSSNPTMGGTAAAPAAAPAQ